jgi:hypothetical protein
VSVLVLPEEELSRFCFKEVTPGSLVFKYVFMLLDCCFVELVVVVTLVIL